MVNTGRPSPACALCRQRKIRCDQLRPACSQCRRLKVDCPGYRDTLNLKFRDGTATARRMVLGGTNASSETARDAALVLSRVGNTRPSWASGAQLSPPRPLEITFNDLAVPFALDYFFGRGTCGVLGNSLVWPVHQAMKLNRSNDAMVAAVKAVGSAALANVRGSTQELAVARRQYGLAVQLTGESIRPENVSNPLLLVLTVLVLSYFEVVTFSELDNMIARNTHLAGLVALLEAYGKTLLQDRTGLCLFIEVRRQIIMNCLQRGVLVPDSVTRWSNRIARAFQDSEERIYSSLSNLQMELCTLREGVVGPATLNDPDRISNLYKLDDKLRAWKDKLPGEWRFEVKDMEPTSDYHINFYYAYRDLNVATAWNDYMTGRLILLDNILTHIDYSITLGETTNHIGLLSEQQTKLNQQIRGLCTEIYASIPQFVGRIENDHPRPHAGGINVVWALFVFASQRCVSVQLKLWAAEQLDVVGHRMGVWQAVKLAKLTRANAQRGMVVRTSDQCSALWGQTSPKKLWYTQLRLSLPNYYDGDIYPRTMPLTAGDFVGVHIGHGSFEDGNRNAFGPDCNN